MVWLISRFQILYNLSGENFQLIISIRLLNQSFFSDNYFSEFCVFFPVLTNQVQGILRSYYNWMYCAPSSSIDVDFMWQLNESWKVAWDLKLLSHVFQKATLQIKFRYFFTFCYANQQQQPLPVIHFFEKSSSLLAYSF